MFSYEIAKLVNDTCEKVSNCAVVGVLVSAIVQCIVLWAFPVTTVKDIISLVSLVPGVITFILLGIILGSTLANMYICSNLREKE